MTISIDSITNKKLLGLLTEDYCSEDVFGYELFIKLEKAATSGEFVQLAEAYERESYKDILSKVISSAPIGRTFGEKVLSALSKTHKVSDDAKKEAIAKFQDELTALQLELRASVISEFFSADSQELMDSTQIIAEFENGLKDLESKLEMAEEFEYETFETINSMADDLYNPILEFGMYLIQMVGAHLTDNEISDKYFDDSISIVDFVEAAFKIEAEIDLIKSKGCKCALCGSGDISMTKKEIDESGVSTSNKCDACETSWSENYILCDVSDLTILDDKLTESQASPHKKHLLETNAARCFNCESDDIESSHVDVDLGEAIAETNCNSCESSWQEIFKFFSVKID